MTSKKFNLIGLPINDLYALFQEKEVINAQRARLIPMHRPGDEIALTSIFLSALRLIKEYKKMVFSSVGFSQAGKIHVFTEVEFANFENRRVDGLICVVQSGKIIDAAKRKEAKDYPVNTSLVIVFDDDRFFRRAMDDTNLDNFIERNILKLDLRFSKLYLVGWKNVFREFSLGKRT